LSRNLDTFLACGVAGVLGNRFFLVLTGYPQVGNGTLHISHAIWGGLMMVVAIGAALSFIAPGVRTFVAILGGAGLGWFVDELGKFITKDVNYFFRPTLALIYVIFVTLYLLSRVLRRRHFDADEGLLNALEAVKAAVIGDLTSPRAARRSPCSSRRAPTKVSRPRSGMSSTRPRPFPPAGWAWDSVRTTAPGRVRTMVRTPRVQPDRGGDLHAARSAQSC
jgi:hypothetical protein